ncbi:MAG: hypothetical protein WAP23_04210 [Candidatus Spechtbacterales bacterium]
MEKVQWQEWRRALGERIGKWLEQEARKDGDAYICVRCSQRLASQTVYMSIHDAFTISGGKHVGDGKVKKFDILECPNRECVNFLPGFWDVELRFDGGTLRGPCIDS